MTGSTCEVSDVCFQDFYSNAQQDTLSTGGHVQRHARPDMPALTLLDVSNNYLQTLSESSMAPVLRNLRLLEMSNNQYYCDCNLTWVGRAFTNSNYLDRFWQRNDITCNAPPHLYGTDVLTLTDENLACANLVPLSTQ
ncbi:hypothetical protein HPB51_023102 [Rhipicephalus microplus]|uniref:LRRCT domain-containing protein n=1 Tax=Rhipicephalus microplus TaxID=6941 RepID=A0A9J6DK64_RHIMP|nr:hypothetical protein HPB51_023102 [Rhipicephalus microplus]